MDLTENRYTGNLTKQGFYSLEGANIQQKIKRKVWVIVLISFLWEKIYPYPHINSGTKIYIKFPKRMHYPLLMWRILLLYYTNTGDTVGWNKSFKKGWTNSALSDLELRQNVKKFQTYFSLLSLNLKPNLKNSELKTGKIHSLFTKFTQFCTK